LSSKNEGAKIVHDVAVETRKLLNKSRESEAPRFRLSADPKVVMNDVLTKIESILDESLLSSDQIVVLLDCLKTRYVIRP
jgi:superfamily I DNA and RNA helicase